MVVLELVLIAMILVMSVVVVTVVVRAPVCTGAVIVFVEVLTVGMRVDVLIIVSDVAVDLSMDASGVIRGGLTNIDIDVLADVNINAFVVVMAVKFAMPAMFSC